MNPVRIAIIVTGHGEIQSVPELVRRIVRDVSPGITVDMHDTIRRSESSLKKEGQLERDVELAARKIQGKGGILIVMDCDWDRGCPALDGPLLLQRARAARPDIPISVVLAKREFETWFLAAAESLRGKRDLPSDLSCPDDPESIRGAKEWLKNKMPIFRGYSETTDQPALAAVMDIHTARRADSFDKFYREITNLLQILAD